MIISVTLNKQTKDIMAGPEILTRGFVYVKDSYDLLNEIKKISENIIVSNTCGMKYIEYNKIKNTIRDELSKYLINQTGNKPMIITVIQEIQYIFHKILVKNKKTISFQFFFCYNVEEV